MRTIFTFLVLGFLLILIHAASKDEPKIDPKIQARAEELFLDQLKRGFLSHRDSSQLRKEALRIHLPRSIKCNSEHKYLEKDY